MCVLLSFVVFSVARSRQPGDLDQAFLDLKNDNVLMDLSAHPDDEDGATLAYYRMHGGVKTYSLFFTRGEGGQNEIGPELYEDLGVLRTSETLAAGRILGSEVHFLNLMDFGYSKTATETFRKWGGQMEVLRRLVYVIRKIKPDVIFTNHNTVDGHGHHQAVAITAIAAFDAAADSTSFPEQLKEQGMSVWQVRKLFFRVAAPTGEQTLVNNPIGEVDPLRKVSYAEIAAEALRMHKTQGMDRIDVKAFVGDKSLYRLVRENSLYDADSTDFFGGFDLWQDSTLRDLAPIQATISRLRKDLPNDSLLKAISRLQGQVHAVQQDRPNSGVVLRVLDHWRNQLERIVRLAWEVTPALTLADPVVVPRQRVPCSLGLPSPVYALSEVRTMFDLPPQWAMNEAMESAPELGSHGYKKEFTLVVGDSPQLTLPRAVAQYTRLEDAQGVTARVNFALSGYPLETSVTASFDVAPPMLLSVEPKVEWFRLSQNSRGEVFRCSIKNYMPHKTAGKIRCLAPAGWRTEIGTFVLEKEDSATTVGILVQPPDSASTGDYQLRFRSDYWADDVTARISDVSLPRMGPVGIIQSYDSTLSMVLHALGAEYRQLGHEDLEVGNLSAFVTIIVDMRAYLVREDLRKFNDRLLEYVKRGGNLVVMYQREKEWKPEYAPYPFRIGHGRVCDEDAPVRVLEPEHPLLNLPNKITDSEWNRWKQERGIYFPTDVGREYTELVSTHDPAESPLTTGYLTVWWGKGTYVYSSLVWYRQLRDMHPGALRCFANMISYPFYRK